MYNSTSDEGRTCQAIMYQNLYFLIQRASTILTEVITWVTVDAEPHFSSHTSSGQVIQGQVKYPDIIAGVSDCVAHTALLTIDKILHSLWNKILQSGNPEGYIKQLFATPDTIEQWRQRAITSFNFVQKESVLAAKPLGFGLRRIQSTSLTTQAHKWTRRLRRLVLRELWRRTWNEVSLAVRSGPSSFLCNLAQHREKKENNSSRRRKEF